MENNKIVQTHDIYMETLDNSPFPMLPVITQKFDLELANLLGKVFPMVPTKPLTENVMRLKRTIYVFTPGQLEEFITKIKEDDYRK